jgi:hypothetical protein
VSGFLDRLLGRVDEGDAAAVERALRRRFKFLEERQGFELAASTRLDDGAVAAYANRPARRGVAIFARRNKGAWAGVGTIPEEGPIPPVTRETVGRGVWREVRRVEVDDQRTLEKALDDLAASLGDRSAA